MTVSQQSIFQRQAACMHAACPALTDDAHDDGTRAHGPLMAFSPTIGFTTMPRLHRRNIGQARAIAIGGLVDLWLAARTKRLAGTWGRGSRARDERLMIDRLSQQDRSAGCFTKDRGSAGASAAVRVSKEGAVDVVQPPESTYPAELAYPSRRGSSQCSALPKSHARY
ncbi:hypothetical protein B0T17DRAFT_506237 [Bombardia bombarda]|uniref:Uncharacterized protein n=1 Tax=Bombardia bombarda TaxID=252184 RepID=A0AA39XA79_9PEZI|nr:hypothetical protein B0T17DRAFT_506237 [Bombardia bombarda]